MTALEARVRERLAGSRAALVELARTRREVALVDLLRRVDETLATLDGGTWGICAVCHDAISDDRLVADPLARICLECFSEEDRRALERDLQAARKVQAALVPPPRVEHGGWEIGIHWEPHGAVSGDHVDLIRPADESDPLHLVIGDVVGKGVAASLLQSHLHALFRALAGDSSALCELLGRANRIFAGATAGSSYATLAALRLHRSGRVEVANAGHPRPLVADARGVRPVEGAGLPLGLFGDSGYETRELRLGPGQTLLLYTDGWTEAARGDEEYGIGRAAAALRRVAGRPLDELLAACRADLARFLGDAPRGDDVTLVAVRRIPEPAPDA